MNKSFSTNQRISYRHHKNWNKDIEKQCTSTIWHCTKDSASSNRSYSTDPIQLRTRQCLRPGKKWKMKWANRPFVCNHWESHRPTNRVKLYRFVGLCRCSLNAFILNNRIFQLIINDKQKINFLAYNSLLGNGDFHSRRRISAWIHNGCFIVKAQIHREHGTKRWIIGVRCNFPCVRFIIITELYRCWYTMRLFFIKMSNLKGKISKLCYSNLICVYQQSEFF